jgi:phosphatidylcholine synthase
MIAPATKSVVPIRWWQRVLGWCAHIYTALGLVAAAAIAALIVDGEPEDYRRAFLLMIAATLIDATDGTFARRVRIKEVVPGFDGRRLDDLIDFLTFTCLPLLLIWRAHLLPAGWEAFLILPLLASAYGFCQVSAKTSDGYFLGFPSYWNLVAFYLYVLRPLPEWLSLGGVGVLALLTFVPTRYLYPSQRGRLNRTAVLLGAGWAALLVWIVWQMPPESPADDSTRRLALLSLFYPAWYMGASWVISVRFWLREREQRRSMRS